MKATDLMIGDWVLAEGNPVQVTNISVLGGDIIRVMNPFMSYDIAYASNIVALSNGAKDINKIEPIPLTPEILEKNRIKLFSTYTHPYRDGEWEEGELEEAMKHYPMYVYEILNPYIAFVIRPNEQELKVCSSNYKTRVEKKEEVIFVHELQHALKLCGIKKEIVL